MAGRIGLVMETLLLVVVTATFWFQLLDAFSNPNEGKTLLSMKASFSKAAQDLLNWDEANGDHCSWRGVVCHNKTFNVMMLNLSSANVGGALGGELSPAIGDLKFLEHIDFEGSGLSGQIPDEIGNCISLKSLDLAFNSLNGDIPFSISQLKGLQFISLKANQLTGPIPSTLSQIPTLQFIDLALNQLTGEIPRLIYWNEMLQYLGLRDNQLTGTLSSDICQLSGLWYFDVRGNNLTGPIPHTIGNCTSFEILDLSYNQFTGEIPYNIGFLQVATLSLQGNKLTGKIPEVIGLMQALAVLDLSNNQLTGEIPPILGNLSYTGKLYLNGNQLTGQIPPEFGNMSRLSYLQLHDNQLVGTVPAELGKLEDLFALNLANNHLEGPIPQNISSCTSLNQFNVHGNVLNGSISVGFEKLESLTYLNLSSNKFSGEISEHLGHIINLDTLDLSDNELVGQIPPALGDLEHLLELNLSRNHLTGPIPSEFGNLKNIQTVDLSNNAINGEIPQDLGQLLNLASLTLSNNSIQGMIPSQLSNCFSLTNLNLSFNNLSGEIPTTNNFSKFPASSFIGNPFLCGNFAGSSSCSNSMQVQADKFPKAAIALVTFGVFTIVALLVLALWRSNRKKNIVKGSSKSSSGYPKMVILHMDMAVHTYEDIMRLTDNLSEKHVIGYGATSIVYKCVLKNCKPIAVKRLHANANSLRDFENELATIGSIKHRNLVCLRGYSLSPHGNLLFYEYMENGSLWDLLHGPTKKVKLDWDTRLKIAVGAAQGLAYLHHDCNPRIVHRDVKSSNILLDENFVAHISDFGIARSIGATKTHASTYVLGTIGYIDPEYARTSRINEKSDVYSFGVVLLELLTGKKPVDDESNLHQEVMTKVEYGNVMEAIDSEVTVTCTDLRQVKKTLQLALLCTRTSPSERPTMYDVSKVLVSLMVLQPTSSSKMSSPTAKVASDSRYVDEYADRQLNRDDIKASPPARNTNNSSDDQWFVKFGEVISQNSR